MADIVKSDYIRPMAVEPSVHWMRRASRLRAGVNFLHWLEAFTPRAVGFLLTATAALLIFRLFGWPIWWFASLAAVGGGALAWVCWIKIQPRLWRSDDALAYLENHAHMETALTAAIEKVGPWPEPRPVETGLRWHGARLCGVWLAAFCLLAGAAFMPVPAPATYEARITEKPSALRQIEQWTETIEEHELAEPEALERLKEAVAALAEQSPENWYDHGSLEAADRLRGSMESALREMARELAGLDSALASAEQSGGLTPEQARQLAHAAEQAAARLDSGALGLESRFAEAFGQMQEMGAGECEGMGELRACLQGGIQGAGECLGTGWGDDWEEFGDQPGFGIGKGDADSAPLIVGEPTEFHQGPEEALEPGGEEQERVLGDLIGMEFVEPETARDFAAGGSGGALAHDETAPLPVSRSNLIPSERQAVQRYFDYE